MRLTPSSFITHEGEMSRLRLWQEAYLIGLKHWLDNNPFEYASNNDQEIERTANRAHRFAEGFAECVFKQNESVSPALAATP
jgi:hypothetical protein